MKRLFSVLCACATLSLFLSACSSERDPQFARSPGAGHFRKITKKMSLERGPFRLYKLGEPGQTMTFLLRNEDTSVVTIDEWNKKEADNIRLFYAFCEPGAGSSVKEAGWIQAWPDPDKPFLPSQSMSPPILHPGNAVMIEIPMNFLLDLPMPKEKPRCTLAVYAQIALDSLQTKSDVYEITVLPKTADKLVQ